MRATQPDVALRLLVALGDLWEGLLRAGIDPSRNGISVRREYLGGYVRISAGPGSHPRVVAEWCESSQHMRVLKREEWPGFEASLSATLRHVREDAKTRGLLDLVEQTLLKACEAKVATVTPSKGVARTPAAVR